MAGPVSGRTDLQAKIDFLVETAIRRILPKVMNEVLLRTLADSGVLAEDRPRPVRRKKAMKRRMQRPPEPRQVREERQPRRPLPPKRSNLNEVLDDSIGSDAYEQYEARAPRRSQPEPEPDFDDHEPEPPARAVSQRLAALDPSLQAMAEGLVMPDDDGGEMWGDGELDSTSIAPAAVSEVRDVMGAAKRVGMDFSKMRALIDKTSGTSKADAEDMKARASFEAQRLKRMRERLNDGKPVE